MATTPINGSTDFPTTENAFYTAVETLAVENIRNLKNTNRIEDGFYEYDIDGNGNVIEEAVIEMAEARNFVNTGAPDFSPIDPSLHIKYFNNFEPKQFATTTRKDEIRKIIAGVSEESVESVTAKILASLSQGEGAYDYAEMRDLMISESVGVDASSTVFGTEEAPKVPASIEGVLYAIRELYNVVKATNTLGTALTDVAQGVTAEDVRIAISESDLNLIDVTKLANIFNLEKVDLMAKLVVIPADSDWTSGRVMVYDRKALGRATRVLDYSQDVIGVGRYLNSYLTAERAYFYNDMFKCFYLDCSTAFNSARSALFADVA